MRKTLENLTKAFVGESQARNRYAIYASAARKEWYLQIAEIFEQTAEQEREHASRFFKMIQMVKEKMGEDMDEVVVDTAAFVKKWTTLENLQYAIDGESYENITMYPDFAKVAKDEGHAEIAKLLTMIGKIEIEHENMYRMLKNRLDSEKEFVSDEEEEWICEICGHVHRGKKALKVCPVCKHPQEYQSRLNSKK